MKTPSKLKILLTAVTLLFLTACKDDDNPIPAAPKEVNLSSNATLGNILVDGNGNTLYFFAKDTNGTSKCEGTCPNTWPIFYVEDLEIGTGLVSSDFGEITRSDGEKQITYKGWPLYYYSPAADGKVEAPGATGGENINSVWFVAKPDYSIMFATTQLVGADGKNYTNSYAEGTGETQYFVDGSGRTLYSFSKDYTNTNTFTAADLSNNSVWPIFYKDLESIPSTLNANDFGMILVHGEEQLTYKGWPLYYYGSDVARGDNKGVSFPSPGVWPVVNGSTLPAGEYTGPTIKLVDDDTFGPILTDQNSRTLYFFTKDINSQNNCTGGCASTWPVFYSEEVRLDAASGLSSDDFGVITTSTGAMQTTYKGWPLYYYSPASDGVLESPGETLGDGVNNVWYVAKESYDLMYADAQLIGHDGVSYIYSGGVITTGTGITNYFTDASGRAIYTFKNDTKDDNNFTASDFSNDSVWPIFHVTIDELPSGMDKSEFGEIDVFGRKQLTFRGWPLYYFGQDQTIRGNNKGISFPSPGVWPIAKDDLAAAQ